MSTEEQKPAVTTEAGVVEPTPATAEAAIADKPVEAVEPKAEDTPKAEGEAVAPVEEAKEEKKEEKAVEPIYSGALGYKAPGLKNAFRFSKKYFWFGEEEPVPIQSLSQYLRGEKAEVAHPTAAWSSQTGKGLLFFVKHADQKETPAGVLNLSEATDLSKDGTVAFFFKLHGHKHTFEAQTLPERNGWFVALEKAIEEAKASKDTIHAKESYKEELTKLGKPAALAATAASAPKKSSDVTPKPAETETPAAAEASAPARAGSSSSSSADEEKKKKKKAAKSKSRSVSRGKRASIFGGFLGKKDKAEEKSEEKKEEKEEKKEEAETDKKAEETPAVAAPAAEASTTTAPVIPPVETELPKATEEPKTEEAAAPATEEKKAEEKPKPTKRGSIFGSFVEKLKSPTHEKKEHEVGPTPPAKDTEVAKEEVPKAEETPATTAAPVAPVTDGTTETPKTEEAKPAVTPAKEKQHFSFGKFLGGAKEKVRSPSAEKAPEAPKTEETPKTTEEAPKLEEVPAVAPIAPIEPAAEAPKEEEKKEETPATTTTTTATATTPKEKAKRGSIFGNLTGSVKKEGDSEKPQGLKGLFRNASKAGKSKKEKEATSTPTKVEETTEPKEEKTEEAPKIEEKTETPVAPAEPAAIGDVVPDAVTVGQAPKSTPQVSTTA